MLDPVTLGTVFNIGTSLFGSFFGGDDEADKEYLQRDAQLAQRERDIRASTNQARQSIYATALEGDVAKIAIEQARKQGLVQEYERRRRYDALIGANNARGNFDSASFRAIQRQATVDMENDVRAIKATARNEELLAQIRLKGLRAQRAGQEMGLADLAEERVRISDAIIDNASNQATSTLFEVVGHAYEGYRNGAFENFSLDGIGDTIGSWFSSSSSTALGESAKSLANIWT